MKGEPRPTADRPAADRWALYPGPVPAGPSGPAPSRAPGLRASPTSPWRPVASHDAAIFELVSWATPAQRRMLELAADVAAEGAAGGGEIAFLARIFVKVTLPLREPGGCTFVRRNGDLALKLEAPPQIGLPYGRYPRLILAYLCREAVWTRSREIRLGDSLSDFMRSLGMHASGGPNGPLRRFRKQAVRLLATTVSWSWTGRRAGASGHADVAVRIA